VCNEKGGRHGVLGGGKAKGSTKGTKAFLGATERKGLEWGGWGVKTPWKTNKSKFQKNFKKINIITWGSGGGGQKIVRGENVKVKNLGLPTKS